MSDNPSTSGDGIAGRPWDQTIRERRNDTFGLMERLPGMVYQCRNDPQWTMEFVSPGATALTGYSGSELLGPEEPTYGSLIHPEDREAVWSRVQEAVQKNEPFDLVYRIVTAQGSQKLVWELGHPVRSRDGELLCIEGFITDPSDRIEIARGLRHSQRLEALGELAAGIAHELNNVLAVVLANVQELEEWFPADAGEPRAWLTDAREMATRGAGLVRKLLAFGRREDLGKEPLDLVEHVTELASTLRRLLPEHVELSFRSDDSPPLILADPRAVEQILMNLTTNARDAIFDGGQVFIAVWPTRLDEDDRARHEWIRPGQYVCLSVSDTGCGMDEETLRRAMEPFFTTKGRGEGTGLGLPIVYGLAKQHDGYVHVYSRPDEGTTVKVYFPASAESLHRATRPPPGPDALPRGSETILVVEDELALARATQRTLERLGYSVLLTHDGEKALQQYRLKEDDIDLVLTDIGLPKLDGRQLYQKVREVQGSNVPFLFVSGHGKYELESRDTLPVSLPFLHKPWTVAELARSVRWALKSRE